MSTPPMTAITGLRRAHRQQRSAAPSLASLDRLVVEEPPQVLGHRLGRR